MSKTGISYLDERWEPLVGCTPASEECRECWARALHDMRHKARSNGKRLPRQYAEPFSKVQVIPERFDDPMRWKKPRSAVGVCFGSDLFHNDVPDEVIVAAFAVMANAKEHTYYVLTKRAARMRDVLSRLRWHCGLGFVQWRNQPHLFALLPHLDGQDFWEPVENSGPQKAREMPGFVPPNIRLGVTVGNQPRADERLPEIVRLGESGWWTWVSLEPLLNRLDVSPWLYSGYTDPPQTDRIRWVVVGGESGKDARPCDVAWIRSIVQQTAAAHVPCYVKQLGSKARGYCEWSHHDDTPPKWLDDDGCIREVSKRPDPEFDLCHAVDDGWWPCAPKLTKPGADPAEWPEDLRVRQLPEVHP